MHPLTRNLALTTLFIPALWGSAYYWGENHADSTSSQYIGAAMLTFFSTAFFLFFNILTMLTLGTTPLVSGGVEVQGHTTILRALLVLIILLAIILAVTGFLFGSGKSNNDTTTRDGAEIGSFAVAVITLVALGFVWVPVFTFKFKA